MCWNCGAKIDAGLNQSVARLETCSVCGKYLHVCKNCKFYNPMASKQCSEPNVELVKDKENSNFCEYFKIADSSCVNSNNDEKCNSKAEEAKKAFDALFG